MRTFFYSEQEATSEAEQHSCFHVLYLDVDCRQKLRNRFLITDVNRKKNPYQAAYPVQPANQAVYVNNSRKKLKQDPNEHTQLKTAS
jgi:hypothetical protein